MNIAKAIDSAIEGRAIVFGSLPPAGRDLDLLARSPEKRLLERALHDWGFIAANSTWARFEGCDVVSVELVSPDSWGLVADEITTLFKEARVVEGFEHLARPSPHHELLILARRAVQTSGELKLKSRHRIERALREDPHAWDRASERSQEWGVGKALSLLQSAYWTGIPPAKVRRVGAVVERRRFFGDSSIVAASSALRSLAPKRRNGHVITFSGLDGSGKTTQAEALRNTLVTLGFDAVVVWAKLTRNPSLNMIARPVKAVLSFLQISRGKHAITATSTSTNSFDAGKELRRERRSVSLAWTTTVALVNALSQRRTTRYHLKRGRIVIRDRYTLDSVVHLRYRYGEQDNFRFQAKLIDMLSTRPLRAYLLAVPAEVALARKPEQYNLDQLRRLAGLYDELYRSLGVQRLGADRPTKELCEQIGMEVWRSLTT